MNNNIKFWKWAVVALILLNLVVIGGIVLRQSHFEKMAEMHQQPNENPAEFIIRELKFDHSQIEIFEKLRRQHHESVDSLQEIGHDLHKRYFDLLSTENPDEKTVNQMASAIADNQKQIELVTFHHFEDVRKLCNTEQKKHFDDIIENVLHRLKDRPNQPPPPR